MSGAVAAAVVASAVVAAGTSIYTSQQQAKASESAANKQKEASDAALAENKKQAELQTQQVNKANAKGADTSVMMAANQQAAKAGGSGTMLTGAQGIDPSTLNLGKSTLLGA